MQIIDTFFTFVTDSSRRMSHKIGAAVFILAVLIFLNNVFGFSFHYRMGRQIQQLAEVNAIISNPSTDSTTRSHANYLRSQIVGYRTILDYLRLSGPKRTDASQQANRNANTNPIKSSIKKDEIDFFLSQMGLIVFIGLISAVMVFLERDDALYIKIGFAILFIFLSWVLGGLVVFITNLIPMLGESWQYNYYINIVTQMGVMFGTIAVLQYLSNRSKKRRNIELDKKIAQGRMTYSYSYVKYKI